MASLTDWLSAGVLQALGWTLIHALWQCLALAALAAALMALSRRPSIRYMVAVSALALMLAAPAATFFVLVKANTAAAGSVSPSRAVSIPSIPAIAAAATPPAAAPVNRAPAFQNFPHSLPAPAGLPLQSLLPWLVAAWLCGVTFLSLRFAGGFLLLERQRRKSGALDPHILSLCHGLEQQMGLKRAIGYVQCNWLEAPAVMGWLRPIVLLPVTALIGLSEDQLRAVIAHELAHVRRLDSYVNLFQILVETLLFYHPAIWWLNRRIRAERELCCDEAVVSLTGDRLEYARALTRMAEAKQAPVLAMAANRGPLARRILHILGAKSSGAGQRVMGLAGGVLFLLAALIAANALIEVAAPPMAQARESIKTALVSIQNATGHLARRALQISQPAAPAAAPQAAPADQTEAAAETLTPPSPDLSRVPAPEPLATPKLIASNDAPTPDRSDALVASAAATGSDTSNAPGPRTEAGILCQLGLGPDGCWRSFETPPGRIFCAGANWGGSSAIACPSGPLENIKYLGTNAAGEDIYAVRFMHRDVAYVLRAPGPDGKMARVCYYPIAGSFMERSCSPSAMAVTSPANPPRILYPRAADRADAGAANAPGPRTELVLACILATTSDGCDKIFLAARNSRPRGYFPSVPGYFVRSTQFAGRNDVGDEIWDVKLQHSERTYVISPPDPDGRVQRVMTRDGPPDRQCDNLVEQRFAGESHIRVSCHIDQQEIAQPATGAAASGAVSMTAAKAEVVPNTPSGAGDPDAVVCRAPQPITGTDQLGSQVCLHNSEWWKAAMNGKDIAPDGKTLIARPMVGYPRGEGDPDDVTCRKPQILDGGKTIAQYGPEICRPNQFWADLIKNRQVVNARGDIVKLPLGFVGGGPGGTMGFGSSANGPGDSGNIHPGQPLPTGRP